MRKHNILYLPVSAKERNPEETGTYHCFLGENRITTHFLKGEGFYLDKWTAITDLELETMIWLEPIIDKVLLSEHELIDLLYNFLNDLHKNPVQKSYTGTNDSLDYVYDYVEQLTQTKQVYE